MKRQRAEISSNVISHIKSAHPIEMWRSNKLGIKEKISRGKFPRLIFSCPVPTGLPHRSHCVPVNMNRWDCEVFFMSGGFNSDIFVFAIWKYLCTTKNTKVYLSSSFLGIDLESFSRPKAVVKCPIQIAMFFNSHGMPCDRLESHVVLPACHTDLQSASPIDLRHLRLLDVFPRKALPQQTLSYGRYTVCQCS